MRDHKRRLQRAERRRRLLALLVEEARRMGESAMRRSNRAWLVSAVAAAGGTLMAVAELRRATRWAELQHALEFALVDATIELHLARERAAGGQYSGVA